MRARGWVAAAVAALTLAGCSTQEVPEAVPALQPQLELSAPDEAVRIGVLVPPIEGAGSEFRPLIEGARVAAYRFEWNGAEIEFQVALDDGTADGARSAMADLVQAEVAGVIAATTGAHTDQALELAAQNGTAVLSPYATAGSGAWSLAPSRSAVTAGIGSALDEAQASRPYLAVAEGRDPLLADARTAVLGDPAPMADEIVALVESREIDSVVIDGPAGQQAALVVEIHGRLGARQLPIVLTPEALTPQFGDRLDESGTTAGWLFSVGTDTGDHVALDDGEAADYAALFFAALSLAAGDSGCQNVYSDDTCAAGLPRADVASHDATVALLRAVEAAGSVDPQQVRTALGGLALDHADGLVGPALDFGSTQALSDDDVVVLHASTSDPGLRPTDPAGDPAAMLFWFAGTER
ncbi:hypothetical protein Cde04nite_21140 [Cellulomonas denverensis]|nr:hypothetical protein Cde04nite_21140 [Cellulomonas denverensis]